jgi:Protein of unknown function (DUF3644)
MDRWQASSTRSVVGITTANMANRVSYQVRTLLEKARDSAFLAVETYNRPTANFRSGGYIVLMIIAWTSFFHALFLRRNVKPYYRKSGSRRYEKIDGDFKCWELTECLKQHYKDQSLALRKNLEFFIKLRNKIEHRSFPQLDTEIFGECQAMLINFETMLCEEFGERYALKTSLSFALQLSRSSPKLPKGKSEQRKFKAVKGFVDQFRSSLSTEVQSDLSYSFKVFLVPKVGNHAAKDAVAVEWVKYDPNKPEEMREYEKIVALIKPKEILVVNKGFLKPSQVTKRVAVGLGKPFNLSHHVVCWRHFNVRPPAGSGDPKACDSRYCVYDEAHRDYVYTEAWVDHLIKTMSDPALYDVLLAKKNSPAGSATAGAAA